MAYRVPLCVVILAAAACGDSPSVVPDAPSIDALPPIDAALPFVQTDNVIDIHSAPVDRAHVCVVDHPEVHCATSDARGGFAISLPQSLRAFDIAMTITAPGYLGFTGLFDKGSVPGSWIHIPLYDDATATEQLQRQAGFHYPAADKGFVRLSIAVGGLSRR